MSGGSASVLGDGGVGVPEDQQMGHPDLLQPPL
jgi:hypothetical protein